jgi:hypothetical protein
LVDEGSEAGLFTPAVREMALATTEAVNKMAYEDGEYVFSILLSAFFP